MRNLTIVLWLSLCVSVLSQAQNISGPLSGTLGPGTYNVVGNCQVLAGNTLVILPGTTLLHTGHYEWAITGLLLAQGTSDSLITFARQLPDTNHYWAGLRFNAATAGGSLLDHCVIEYCDNYYRTGGGIYCNNAAVTIANSAISNCVAALGGGLYATYSGIVVEDCDIFDNLAADTPASDDGSGGGIYLDHSNTAQIRRTWIWGNHAGGA